MLHMYLLVSLFSIFSMDPINIHDVNILNVGHQVDVQMEFASAPQVHIGDPVLYKGAVVGNVSRVQNVSRSSDTSAATRINIKLTSASVPLGTAELVGLVSSMKVPGKSSVSSKSFVDLMYVSDFKKSPVKVSVKSHSGSNFSEGRAESLRGFSSFQEFWSTSSL